MKEKELIRPLGENVLVKILRAGEKTKSGLFLPKNISQEKPQEGKVVNIGESVKIKIKKNQRVIFSKSCGTEIKFNGEDYLILKGEDILAVIE